MRTYFIRSGQKVSGPFTLAMIKDLGLPGDTYIRHADAEDWTTVNEVEELDTATLTSQKATETIPTPVVPYVEVLPANSIQNNTASAQANSKKKKRLILFMSLVALLLVLVIVSLTLVRTGTPSRANVLPEAPVQPNAQVAILASETKEVPAKTNEAPDQAKLTRKNWSRYIKVSNSNYAFGVLGGIHDLTVTFTNNTDYPLDEMTAKITYIKSNGKPWKTKTITVYNVPAHGERKKQIEKVNRGKSVQVTVQKVKSSRMQFCYTAGKWASGNADDPYLCK
ncbi:MAG TPA: DUF4339 domain-containing protein [Flavisolibacter sp.]|jgi:hypothetical protein